MAYDFIGDNINKTEERIAKAAYRSGRRPEDIELLAVSKFRPIEAAMAAYAAGVRHFGENRVQEAMQKYSPEARNSMPGASLSMIGTLQGNKAGKAAKFFDSIQSVDSSELLLSLAVKSIGRDSPLQVFLELHTGEESKSGFPDLDSMFRAIDAYHAAAAESPDTLPIMLSGLMTMAPNVEDEVAIRKSFRSLERAREEIVSRYRLPEFTELSMGMSSDFEIAIEEGSTCVRIGTAIFGARQ
ncbi:MAG: YggS family pyridoxal phosphate-dependent enzyme [Spirochaetaceae bacterium]|nr:YggS family pyridoxal phosphate-dependent enzyme [Spirochaetaceae bacterium]